MNRYLSLEFDREENLRDIVKIASGIMQTPVSMITLLDKDVQWIISSHGIDLKQMPRETSFCTHAIDQQEVMVVSDAAADSRFENAPLVKFPPSVRFYAGAPLRSDDGFNIGTLCVFHNRPCFPDDEQLKCLDGLSRQVSNIMNLNQSLQIIRENYREIEMQHNALRKIAYLQSHEIRAPLCNALAAADLIRTEDGVSNEFHFSLLEDSLKELDKRVHSIVMETNTQRISG